MRDGDVAADAVQILTTEALIALKKKLIRRIFRKIEVLITWKKPDRAFGVG